VPAALDVLLSRVVRQPLGTEDALCDALAAHLRSLDEAVLVREDRGDRKRPDLALPDRGIELEVKYWRPIRSGYNRPMSQQFGQLLGDVAKLARSTVSECWCVLFTDQAGFTHLVNKKLLPVTVGQKKGISPRLVDALPDVARRGAISAGDWLGVSATCRWLRNHHALKGVGWLIERNEAIDSDRARARS